MHAIADDPYMSYQDMTEDLLPFTWYTSANNYYPQKTWCEKGVCRVGTLLPDRGIKNGDSEMC